MSQIILDSANDLIQGDFDNATLNGRTRLQTTTTNATTNVYVIPNGSATSAGYSVSNNSNLTNASKIVMATNGTTDTQIISGVNGSGTYLPLSFYTNNALAAQIDTSGNMFVGPTASQNGATGVVYSKTTAKAWVTFFGNTATILASFNVSSLTRVSAGVYTVTFTSAMPNANYSSFYMAQPTVTNAGSDTFTINPTTTTVQCNHWEANVARDSSYSCVVVFGSA